MLTLNLSCPVGKEYDLYRIFYRCFVSGLFSIISLTLLICSTFAARSYFYYKYFKKYLIRFKNIFSFVEWPFEGKIITVIS